MATSRSVNLNIRARPREMKKWKAAAKRVDETLSEWIRSRLNLASVPPPPPVPPAVSGDQVEFPFQALPRRAGRSRARIAVVSVDEMADRARLNGKLR